MDYQGHELRNELKFAINDLEYVYLKSRLKNIMKLDKNAMENGEYHIRSLYFDDYKNTSFYAKEGGVFQRTKYRIRIYNKSDEVINLERKDKYGKYISKTSRMISKGLYYHILENKHNIHQFKDDEFLLNFYVETKINRLKPVVIVDYLREPYIYKYGNVRITFDKNLQAIINTNDIFHKSPIYASARLDGTMILEIKYDDYLPESIRKALRLSRHQLMAISKYVICRELKDSLCWKEGVM